MKRLFLTFLMILSIIATYADVPKALFVYGKEGSPRAFFYDDIVKLTLSRTDTNDIQHEKYVSQEIHTVDSIYRIPLVDIDSIGFHPLPTILHPGVSRLTENFEKYILSLDENDIHLSKSIPASLIPSVGSKLVSTTVNDRQPYGIRCSVTGIEHTTDEIILHAEELALTDAYQQLFDAYTLESYYDLSNPDDVSLKMRERERNVNRLSFNTDGIIQFDPFELDTPGFVNILDALGVNALSQEEVENVERSFDIGVKAGVKKFILRGVPQFTYNAFLSITPQWNLENKLIPVVEVQSSGSFNMDFTIEQTTSLEGTASFTMPSDALLKGEALFKKFKDKYGVVTEFKGGFFCNLKLESVSSSTINFPIKIGWCFNKRWEKLQDYLETAVNIYDGVKNPSESVAKYFPSLARTMSHTLKNMTINYNYAFGSMTFETGFVTEFSMNMGVPSQDWGEINTKGFGASL